MQTLLARFSCFLLPGGRSPALDAHAYIGRVQLKYPATHQVALCVALAFVFWTAVFGFKVVNFWLGLSAAAAVLMVLSIIFTGIPLRRDEFTLKNALTGLAGAAALYGIFAVSNTLAPLILPFAKSGVSTIYAIREQANPVLIACILVLLTSPCEELFWRGFLQRWAMHRLGPVKGWLCASCVYAAVHIASLNIMLIGAAMVAGLFWGFMYMRGGSLFACIVSHAAWTIAIFILWPMA